MDAKVHSEKKSHWQKQVTLLFHHGGWGKVLGASIIQPNSPTQLEILGLGLTLSH